MKYIAYKFCFETGVHFGNGNLNDTKYTLSASTLFSALCIEALNKSKDTLDKLYTEFNNGKLLITDAFPFEKDILYIPKPMIQISHTDDDITNRKLWKNIKYIPITDIKMYCNGLYNINNQTGLTERVGRFDVIQKVNISDYDKPEPYNIGIFKFKDYSGLYIILGYEDDLSKDLVEELLDSLGYSGIGGKVSSGLGKYSLLPIELPDIIKNSLSDVNGTQILLTTSLPKDHELEDTLLNANYLMERQSGFIQSCNYANTFVKKDDKYFFKAGSTFSKRFSGDIYNVGTKGNHPVWRYGKPIFMGVNL